MRSLTSLHLFNILLYVVDYAINVFADSGLRFCYPVSLQILFVLLYTLTPLSQRLEELKADINMAKQEEQNANDFFKEADDLIKSNASESNQKRFDLAILRKTNMQLHFTINVHFNLTIFRLDGQNQMYHIGNRRFDHLIHSQLKLILILLEYYRLLNSN